jgi:lysylphosphatidylglycerol synthetase-like protein (DUF2156 family)
LGVGSERCEDKGEKSAPKFIPSSNYHQEEKTIKSTKTHYPSNPKPSFNPKKEVRKETPKPREEAFVCMFCGHIAMTYLSFCLILTLVLHLVLLFVLCLSSLMDLTITHMVLVHERAPLCPNALVTAHVLIMVTVSYIGLVFLLEGLTLTLSGHIWMVHIFPIVVHVPLSQILKCKEL